MHPTLTPLADDVNFRELAEKYEVSGGDIRNAVLKAALAAASEPLPDTHKLVHHRHLEDGIRDVIAGKRVMKQSLFDDHHYVAAPRQLDSARSAAYAIAISGAALIVALIALIVGVFLRS
jgi:hypothetical protein